MDSNPTYWEAPHALWARNRVHGCACEFCHGTDICTIQQCWNTFYGAKNGGSSATFSSAKGNVAPVVSKPMHCVMCNDKNDYAEPNRADGTYVRFNCRNP